MIHVHVEVEENTNNVVEGISNTVLFVIINGR